ncbi:alpha/beta fold hydrolase [Rhodopila sp.]|uniref:alpha/beta fold hydrolase n=1 Tax=Rhodopila sp. TaxID=2480087 RepID=UPI002CCEDBA5|nr:alpha/beta hydrolase [Rhodopila sp.]HVZ09216.1 alpha/beta hydrolase [Rhodopila sp.]
MAVIWTDSVKEIAGCKLHLSRAGSGPTVLVLHHDIGSPDRLPFYDALAQKHDVVIPHHPGWGKSERPAWLRHPRDIAAMYSWLLADLGVTGVSLVGLGFGGWIATEMASQAPTAYRRLVLLGASGIKPPEGDIMDQSIVSYIVYPRSGFHAEAAFKAVYGDVSTDQLEAWDIAREMSFRVAWKPYMYSQTLPHLLGGVRTPALLIWGDDDQHVPISAAHAYEKALPNAKLTVIPACGHFAEMEKPDEVAGLVTGFIGNDHPTA